MFFGLTTMVRPSKAMGTSMNSIFAFAARSNSLFLIGRDASAMSISPAMKRLKPPPVPLTPTVTRTLGAAALNSSATASVIG